MTIEQSLDEIGYGVCDSPAQLAAKFPAHRGTVWMTVVLRSDQSEWGGWRWHKWGQYVGDHVLDEEYLYDCPHIDEQWLFSTDRPRQNIGGLDDYRAWTLADGVATPTVASVRDNDPFIRMLRAEMVRSRK
jgi:hypothetical protein